jgi:O-antigen ligase
MIINLNKFFVFLIFLLPPLLITGPAIPDIIITISSIFFLIFYLIYNVDSNKDIDHLPIWLIAGLAFYIGANISSIFAYDNLFHSLSSSLPYIRFILFSLFLVYFFLKLPWNYFIIINIIGISIFFVSIDICFQYFVGYDIFGFPSTPERNAGPFGDELKGGSYISKFYIPVFTAFYFFSLKSKIYKTICVILFITCFMGLILSGERAAIILFLFSNIIFLFVIFFENIKIYIIILLAIFSMLLITSNFLLSDNFKDRYFVTTFNQIKNINNIIDSHYGAHYLTAYNIFLDNPILGVGQNNFRNICSEKKYSQLKSARINDRCSTHPHNYFFQILSDLGIINFLIFLILIISIFFEVLKNKNDTNKIILYGKLIGLMVIFWPLLPTGSFYNNWLSVMNWLIISISICRMNKDYTNKLLSFLK